MWLHYVRHKNCKPMFTTTTDNIHSPTIITCSQQASSIWRPSNTFQEVGMLRWCTACEARRIQYFDHTWTLQPALLDNLIFVYALYLQKYSCWTVCITCGFCGNVTTGKVYAVASALLLSVISALTYYRIDNSLLNQAFKSRQKFNCYVSLTGLVQRVLPVSVVLSCCTHGRLS